MNADYPPATPPASAEREERLSGVVAVIIALATLIAATAGFLQADASNRAGDKRDQAEQLSLQALASAQSSEQDAQVELETFERWVEQRTQAGNALVAGLFAGDNPVRADALQREAERWQTLADKTLSLSDIDPQGEFGPERDPTFPGRYFAAATEESLRLNALQDAANEEASVLDQRAAGYTAILATLAVSLYLFGLTLAVRGNWLRLGFLGVGLSLLGVGTLWMALTVFAPSFTTNDEAAAEYARGRVAFITAYDAAGFAQAEAHLDRAIELRPTFARAYAERADVIFEAASPQRTGFTSIAPPEALGRARADLETARALGLENAQTFGSLGFYAFAEGVQSGDTGLLDQAIDYSRRAIGLDSGEPLYRYNLAVTLAAEGRIDEARGAYDDAVARTLYIDDALTVLRQAPGIEETYLAGGLTDLEIVRRYRTDLQDQIKGLKEHIVGRVAMETTGRAEPVAGGLQRRPARHLPGRAAMAGQHRRLRPAAGHHLGPVVLPGSAGAGLGGHTRGIEHRPAQGDTRRPLLPALAVPQPGQPAGVPALGPVPGRDLRQRPARRGGLSAGRLRRLRGVHGARSDQRALPAPGLAAARRSVAGLDRWLHQRRRPIRRVPGALRPAGQPALAQ